MRFLSIVVIAALVSAIFGPASESGAQPPQDPNAPKAQENPIAIVLGKPIYLKGIHPDEADKTSLRDYWAISEPIVPALVAKYIKEHRLAATPLEIKNYRTWLTSLPNLSPELADQKLTPEDDRALDEMAKFDVENWKLKKSLYEKYGGRVVFQQAGLEPLDALQNWLRDEEKADNFKIFDPKWRDAFWEYYKPKYHRFDDEPNPFKVPLWENAK